MDHSLNLGFLIVLAVVVFVPVVYVVNIFNRLVRLRRLVRNAWSNIDTELKRRHDLIPRLVEVVKGYAEHEREVLDRVVQARDRAVHSSLASREHQQDESELARSTRGLLAVAERYPELKASTNFLQLQEELVRTEDRIAAARRFYNGNVKDLNTLIEQFPSHLIASSSGFETAEPFQVESIFERQPPSSRLS